MTLAGDAAVDRFGRSPADVEDELKYSFAAGTLIIREIAETLLRIHRHGDRIRCDTHANLQHQLYLVYEHLGSATTFGMGEEPETAEEFEALATFCDTYSDGSPTVVLIGDPRPVAEPPPRPYPVTVPWLPRMSGPFGYLPCGPTPTGCMAAANQPPSISQAKGA